MKLNSSNQKMRMPGIKTDLKIRLLSKEVTVFGPVFTFKLKIAARGATHTVVLAEYFNDTLKSIHLPGSRYGDITIIDDQLIIPGAKITLIGSQKKHLIHALDGLFPTREHFNLKTK